MRGSRREMTGRTFPARMWASVHGVVATRVAVASLGAAVVAGCELTEVELIRPDDLVVAEVQVVLTLEPGGLGDPPRVRMAVPALLHKVHGVDSGTLSGASVRISGEFGNAVALVEAELNECIAARYEEEYLGEGSCYTAPAGTTPFAPGEELSVEVRAPGGQVLTGDSRIPGAFDFTDLAYSGGACRLEPDANHRLRWTPADDVWSYLGEAEFTGLRAPLATRGIEAPDTLDLIALSIGREDSEIAFPRDFGLLDLFDDDGYEDVILALQDGLPGGAGASLSISAVDRNWANWARRGDFHPSGRVRISSVFGDGGGVFGTAVQRRLEVVAGAEGEGEREGLPPSCGLPGV